MSMRLLRSRGSWLFSLAHRDHRRVFADRLPASVFGKTSRGGLDIDADEELRTLVFAVAAPVNPSGLARWTI
jgi:hypothetical protein